MNEKTIESLEDMFTQLTDYLETPIHKPTYGFDSYKDIEMKRAKMLNYKGTREQYKKDLVNENEINEFQVLSKNQEDDLAILTSVLLDNPETIPVKYLKNNKESIEYKVNLRKKEDMDKELERCNHEEYRQLINEKKHYETLKILPVENNPDIFMEIKRYENGLLEFKEGNNPTSNFKNKILEDNLTLDEMYKHIKNYYAFLEFIN